MNCMYLAFGILRGLCLTVNDYGHGNILFHSEDGPCRNLGWPWRPYLLIGKYLSSQTSASYALWKSFPFMINIRLSWSLKHNVWAHIFVSKVERNHLLVVQCFPVIWKVDVGLCRCGHAGQKMAMVPSRIGSPSLWCLSPLSILFRMSRTGSP